MTTLTPFEQDILEQPEALLRLAEPDQTTVLRSLAARDWDRIILTGMGSSHYVGLPTWRALSAAGRAAWTVDTGQLLDTPDLLTGRTLLIATSQSGASGEVVELLDRIASGLLPAGLVVGVTSDGTSPLATRADITLDLLSGPEATVSTKSYLNTLAVHRKIVGAFLGEDPGITSAEIVETARLVHAQLRRGLRPGLAARILDADVPRLVAVGKRDDAATALYAGLITKESSKVMLEGFVGGQFRHGPLELAGPGMTAFLYGARASECDPTIDQLANDLVRTGADVLLVGDLDLPGTTTILAPGPNPLASLCTGAVAAEQVAVDLALAGGVVPGEFAFGSKVTTAL